MKKALLFNRASIQRFVFIRFKMYNGPQPQLLH